MNIILLEEAEHTLMSIMDFVDSINTEGSGERWGNRFRNFIKKYAVENVQYSLCLNSDLAALGLSCIHFNGWVIAFKRI